jgi:hypothetical protein
MPAAAASARIWAITALTTPTTLLVIRMIVSPFRSENYPKSVRKEFDSDHHTP